MFSLARRSSAYFLTVVACGGVTAVGGCGSKGVVGKWTGSVPMQGQTIPMTVEFKADGTEQQTATIMGQPLEIHSTYTVKDDTLTETISSVTFGGKTMPQSPSMVKTDVFSYKLDGESLTFTAPGKPTIALKRADK